MLINILKVYAWRNKDVLGSEKNEYTVLFISDFYICVAL